VDESRDRLHRAGWCIGDACFGRTWLVSGANGENVIRAEGSRQPWRTELRRLRRDLAEVSPAGPALPWGVAFDEAGRVAEVGVPGGVLLHGADAERAYEAALAADAPLVRVRGLRFSDL
jgi:hypothetical protein